MGNLPHTAMIFAAGLGTRMRPLTDKIPKAMVQVLGKPLIDYRIEKLIEAGVKKIVINTHYKADIIHHYLAKRSDVEIVFSYEKEILETGGGLVHALPLLGDDPFYIINCDTIWLDKKNKVSALIKIAKMFEENTADIVMLLKATSSAIGYEGLGDFSLDAEGHIMQPPPPRPYVYTGVQICNPTLFKGLKVEKFSLSDVWKKHMRNNADSRIYGVVHSGDWLHIDSVDNLQKAEDFIAHLS